MKQDSKGWYCPQCISWFDNHHSEDDCKKHQEWKRQEKIRAERKKDALFQKAGNQSYGSIPWARGK